MIVHDKKDPYAGKYDEEFVMTVSGTTQTPLFLQRIIRPD